mgnify:CR=1 FL=1
MRLLEIIDKYVDSGKRGVVSTLGDEFMVITNPSFAVLPYQLHRTPITVASYCRRGRARGRVNALTYNIEEGGLFIVLPGQLTELLELSDDFEASYILMTEEFTNRLGIRNTFDLQNIIKLRPYTILSGRARESVEGYFKMSANVIEVEANPHRAEIIHLVTRALFLGLGYFIHEQDVNEASNSRATKLASEFLDLVEANYREHRDLKFYAERLGLTTKYMSTTIKESSGKSAMEWIERYVTLDAIAQLTSTNRSIKHIAYDLNFPSLSCFGKYFTRVVGLSPSAYRHTSTHRG